MLFVYIFLGFFFKLSNSQENFIEFDKISLIILKEYMNYIVGTLQTSFENKNISIRYESCRERYYLQMCGKFGYDKTFTEVYECNTNLNENLTEYLEITDFFYEKDCCHLFVLIKI